MFVTGAARYTIMFGFVSFYDDCLYDNGRWIVLCLVSVLLKMIHRNIFVEANITKSGIVWLIILCTLNYYGI